MHVPLTFCFVIEILLNGLNYHTSYPYIAINHYIISGNSVVTIMELVIGRKMNAHVMNRFNTNKIPT